MLGDQKVDEFGELFLKHQNKNCHSCISACGMGVEHQFVKILNCKKMVLTNSFTFSVVPNKSMPVQN